MFDIIIKEADSDDVLAQIRCQSSRCTIGKSRGNLVQLTGWRLGGTHAELVQTDKGIFIEDKGTSLGTRVNSARVKQYGPLRSSDTILIDSYRLFVGLVDEETAGSATEDTPVEQSDSVMPEPALAAEVPMPAAEHSPAPLPTPQLKSVMSFSQSDEASEQRQEVRMWSTRIHQQLVRMMDLRRTEIEKMDESSLRETARTIVIEVIEHIGSRLPEHIDKNQLVIDVLNEAIGLGPLEELLADEAITEIMVNSFDDIYIEKAGNLTRTPIQFSSHDAVLSAIERIVSPLGRRIDESSPMVDARLKDGSRVNAVIPPLALRGPCVTIRKFSKRKLTSDDLISFGAVDPRMVAFLEMAVEFKKNIIIAGGTGSGKTTLLNVLSNFIPDNERIITVEDAAELKLNKPHLVSLEARPPNLEGKGAITIRDLVKNCLRMRPDRIVVGECRGGEALDMLQAMNTGHEGSLTTVHANTPRDTISRLEVMVMMAGMELPMTAIREQVASAIDIIVQQTRFSDGSRRVTYITEVTGVEGNTIQLQDIFRYKQTGIDENRRITGHFMATGQIPEFYEDLQQRGIPVDLDIFRKQV